VDVIPNAIGKLRVGFFSAGRNRQAQKDLFVEVDYLDDLKRGTL